MFYRRLAVRVVSASRQTGVPKGLSRMRGNSHVRFLEGWAGAIPPGHSTAVRFFLARNRRTKKTAEATVRALAEGRPPERGKVEEDAQLPRSGMSSQVLRGLICSSVFTLHGVTPTGVRQSYAAFLLIQ